MGVTLWTIGHSSRTAGEFLALLEAHRITGIADVRAFPVSRRHPHFSREPLRRLLASHGIAYRHLPGLGGHRTPRPDSPNGAWREAAFRGYADHLATPVFRDGLRSLLDFANEFAVSAMCAESRWRECHRQLIADVLLAEGHDVRHIMCADEPDSHALSRYARISGTRVTYPALV